MNVKLCGWMIVCAIETSPLLLHIFTVFLNQVVGMVQCIHGTYKFIFHMVCIYMVYTSCIYIHSFAALLLMQIH